MQLDKLHLFALQNRFFSKFVTTTYEGINATFWSPYPLLSMRFHRKYP